jgi:hypothetical protein
MDAKYNQIVDHPFVRLALQCVGFLAWMTLVYGLMSAAVL